MTATTSGKRETTGMDKLWGVKEVSAYLGVPVQTVYQWRKRKYGPPGRKIGRHVRYRPSEVERWIDGLDGRVA